MSDGRLVALELSGTGAGVWSVTALRPDGTVDPSFAASTSGVVATLLSPASPARLAVGADDRINVAGDDPVSGTRVVRLTGAGAPSPFATSSAVDGSITRASRPLSGIALSSDGRPYLAATPDDGAQNTKIRVERLATDGSLDASFNPTGAEPGILEIARSCCSYDRSVTTDHHDRLIVTGALRGGVSFLSFAARFAPAGRCRRSFRSPGVACSIREPTQP